MKCYKLTDSHARARWGTPWGPGVSHEAPGGGDLYSDGWIYVHDDPLLAVLMDPIQEQFTVDAARPARLWLSEGGGATLSNGIKRGVQRCTTVKEIPLPVIATEERVQISILVALKVYSEPRWLNWAEKWLSSSDRSGSSAVRAVAAAGTVAVAQAADAAGWAAVAGAGAMMRAPEAARAAAARATAGEAEAAAQAADAAAWATLAAIGRVTRAVEAAHEAAARAVEAVVGAVAARLAAQTAAEAVRAMAQRRADIGSDPGIDLAAIAREVVGADQND